MSIQVSSTLENRDNRELNVLPGSSAPWVCRKAASETGKIGDVKPRTKPDLETHRFGRASFSSCPGRGRSNFKEAFLAFSLPPRSPRYKQ